MRELRPRSLSQDHKLSWQPHRVHEIDPSYLSDPPTKNGDEDELFVGRGCFGIVKVQLYRGLHVAVKEFLPRSLTADVMHEASILSSLCHPYLPLLFGVCVKQKPYSLIMQFHAFEGLQPSTVNAELKCTCINGYGWIILCAQLAEAIFYLHEEAKVLHNDIKTDNILITKSPEDNNQVVLIDFGKATHISEAKRYHLSETERSEYTYKYPHMAPEVIYGESSQTTFSDMFSFGKVIYKVIDYNRIVCLSHKQQSMLNKFTEQLISPTYFSRPDSKLAIDFFKKLLLE